MKVIVAPDSFKGTLSSIEITNIISDSILDVSKKVEVVRVPLGDGGAGSYDVVKYNLKTAKEIFVKVHDPLNKVIKSSYLDIGNGICYIEIAKACGLPLIPYKEGNAAITTSYGVGELILDALDKKFKRIILGLGGSATNDCGIGLLIALGAKFVSKGNREITLGRGEDLIRIKDYDFSTLDPRLKTTKFTILTDVKNMLVGKNGATRIFGPQKGAHGKVNDDLEEGMLNLIDVVKNKDGMDLSNIVGGGAAGGLGACCAYILNARLEPGIDFFINLTKLDQYIKGADYIFIGEGKIDNSSLNGKTISGVCELVKNNDKKTKVIALCGRCDIDIDKVQEVGVDDVYQLFDKEHDLKFYKENTPIRMGEFVDKYFKMVLLELE